MRPFKQVFEDENFQFDYQTAPQTPQHLKSKAKPFEFKFEDIEFKAQKFPFEASTLRYKNSELCFSIRDYLPRIAISQSIIKKLKKLSSSSVSVKDLSLLVTSQVKDKDGRLFVTEDLSYCTNDAQNAQDTFGLSFAYRMIEDTDENVDGDGIIDKLRSQIIEASKDCNHGISEDNYQAILQSKTELENSERSYISNNDGGALRQNDFEFLQSMRFFLVLIRNLSKPKEQQLTLHKLIYFPNIALRLSLIHQPFKLVASPLTSYLTKRNSNATSSDKKKKSSLSFGFLCIDKGLRVLPIMPSDPLITKVPLIGVWLFGFSSSRLSKSALEDEIQQLLSVALRYISNTNLQKQQYSLSSSKTSFMTVLFSHDESAQFYESELITDCATNEEVMANQWALLKNSDSGIDLDSFASKPITFSFNSNLLIKNLDQLQDGILKTPRSCARVRAQLDYTKSNNHQQYLNDSLAQYISFEQQLNQTPVPQRSLNQSNDPANVSQILQIASDGEEDFEQQFSLPKPQPHPIKNFYQSNTLQNSHRTAKFVSTSDQTFTPEAFQGFESNLGSFCGKTKFTDSRGVFDNPLTASDIHEDKRSNNQSSEKLSPFAERMLHQQAQQLKFLQQQIMNLQTSLLNQNNKGVVMYPNDVMNQLQMLMHLNTQMTLGQNLSTVTPSQTHADNKLIKQASKMVDSCCGNGDSTTEYKNKQVDENENIKKQIAHHISDTKRFVTKSTNTTFCITKNELTNNLTTSGAGNSSGPVQEVDTSINIIASKFEDLEADNSLYSGNEKETSYSQVPSQNIQAVLHHLPNNYDQNHVSEAQNTSRTVSECPQLSISKIQLKANDTENDDHTYTEDEIILRMTNNSQQDVKSQEMPTPLRQYAQLQHSDLRQYYQTQNYKNADKEDMFIAKENIDSNRKSPGLIKRKFLVDDSNETMEDLTVQIVKLRTPDELAVLPSKSYEIPRTNIVKCVDSANQSMRIPRINYDLNNQCSDSSDDDMKKIEARYLNNRRY